MPRNPKNRLVRDPSAASASKTVSFGLVVLLTLSGSIILGFSAFLLHHPDLSLGAGAGGLFSILNYTGLRVLSARLLSLGHSGSGHFWIWSLFRYGLAALVFLLLVRVSVLCLLGALAVYLWFLGILFWAGTRNMGSQKPIR
jgi:hypothetical protein